MNWDKVRREEQVKRAARIAAASAARGRRRKAQATLDAGTVAELRDHRKRQLEERLSWGPAYADTDYVFCREDGTPYAPDYITRAFRDAIKRAAVPRIRLHDLRHTWASLAVAAGVNPKVVSERLGHATVSFTLGLPDQARGRGGPPSRPITRTPSDGSTLRARER